MQIPIATMIKLLVITLLLLLGHSFSTAVPYHSDNQNLNATRNRFLQRLLSYQKNNYESGEPLVPHYTRQHMDMPKEYFSAPLYKIYQSNVLPNAVPESVEDFAQGVDPLVALSSNIFSEPSVEQVLPDILRQEQLVEELEDRIVHRRHISPRLSKREKRRRRKERKRRLRAKNKSRRRKKKEESGLAWEDVLQTEGAYQNISGEIFGDCCPSERIVLHKQVGKNRENHAVEVKPELFTYERVCLPQVVGKSCTFPKRSLRKGVKTRCVQYYSWSPTLVRGYKSKEDWHLDYISVRAGCACQIKDPPVEEENEGQKKRKKKSKRRKRKLLPIDDDISVIHRSQLSHNVTQY